MSYTVVGSDPLVAHRDASVHQLLERCRVVDRHPPLSDHALAALVTGAPDVDALVVLDAQSRLVGYAQATPTAEAPPTWTIDIAIDPADRHDHVNILDSTFDAILAKVRRRGGRAVQWWCHQPTDADRNVAERHGLRPTRELLEMRMQMATISDVPPLATDTFVPGADETALLEVNNAAFADHPDQGNWTIDSLTGRVTSDWFDPAGLLIHRSEDGTMLGICWTKIHRSPTGPLGEIYVVAVRPAFQGRGLGRALTHAGLVSLRGRGIDHALRFVDSTNTTAQSVYRNIGFAIVSRITAMEQTINPSASRSVSERSLADRARSRGARRALERLPPASTQLHNHRSD